MAAVARSYYKYIKKEWWSGKNGMWVVGEEVAALRSSRSYLTDTMEWKSDTMTKKLFK